MNEIDLLGENTNPFLCGGALLNAGNGKLMKYRISAKELLEFLTPLHEFQYRKNRPVDPKRVSDMVDAQKSNNRKYGCYTLVTNDIVLGECNGKYVILDGQHRLYCYADLLRFDAETLTDAVIFVTVFHAKDEVEQKLFFDEINNHTVVVPKYYTDAELHTVIDRVELKLRRQFSSFFSASTSPNRPNINSVTLKEKMSLNETFREFITANGDDGGERVDMEILSEKIYSIFMLYNTALSRKQAADFKQNSYDKAYLNAHKRICDHPSNGRVFFGLVKNYEWITAAFGYQPPAPRRLIINTRQVREA